MGINLGSYASAAAQISDASDELQNAWIRVQSDWNDDNSRHFEEDHLQPVLKELKMAFQAIQGFTNVLGQADRACNPERESDHF